MHCEIRCRFNIVLMLYKCFVFDVDQDFNLNHTEHVILLPVDISLVAWWI